MRKIFFIIPLLYTCAVNFGQKSKEVRDIKGSSIISGDISPNQAKLMALNDAKTNALKAAGINERINAYQMLFTSHAKNDYSQFFSSDIQSEIQGAVKSYSITSEKIYCKNEIEIACDITIEAEVVKYDSKPDVSFSANVEGIKGVYNNGENLSFEVKASQKCFLTIFNITDTEASLLFPNQYEKNNNLQQKEVYKFPQAQIDYSLGNEQKKQETNRLIMVFTKSEVAYMKIDKNQATTADNIFSWIYSISPDQRRVEYFTLTILK